MNHKISIRQEQPTLEKYLAELINAQLENRIPDPLPEQIEIKNLIEIAERGQMEYLILGALLKQKLPSAWLEPLRQRLVTSTVKTFEQVCLVKELQARLEATGIHNQVLKGAVLKYVYPTPEMREMSDIDIMIYETDYSVAEKVICSLGFQKVKEVKHHIIYMIQPFLMLEMHWNLYDKNVDRGQFLYFKNNFRAKLQTDCKYTYYFSSEDFYVYMISHIAKHFYETGCGIRNLIDIYVYLNKYENEWNQDYVASELKKCGLVQFEKHMRTLSFIWLEQLESTEFYNNLFAYMLDCGIYGKGENGVWSQIAKAEEVKKGQIKSVRRWYYFPPLTYMKEYYGWISKYPFLLPAGWMVRAVHGTLHKEGLERKKLIMSVVQLRKNNITDIYKTLHLDFKK